MNKSLNEQVALLRARKHLLGDSDEAFAHSLVQFFETRGYLSEKQAHWVGRLLDRCDAAAARQERSVENIFDGTKLRDLFVKASSNLKFPSIKIQLPEDPQIHIHFYRAGALSKTPGWILITNGKQWPHRALLGSINIGGEGELRKTLRPEVKVAILKIANDPINQAKVSGIRFSHCCFCGLELTNSISLYHGYGPICAGKWGLPWEGEVKEEDKKKEEKHIELVDLTGEDDER